MGATGAWGGAGTYAYGYPMHICGEQKTKKLTLSQARTLEKRQDESRLWTSRGQRGVVRLIPACLREYMYVSGATALRGCR